MMKKTILASFTLLLALTACKFEQLHENLDCSGLDANFSIQNNNCEVPCQVTFTSSAVGLTSYSWNFGDGNTSTDPNPVHIYAVAGTYTATLQVSDDGCVNSSTQMITISPCNINADFALDKTSCQAPCIITITNNSSDAATYSWDFGDGGTSSQENPTHTYTESSDQPFQVKLVVTNGESCTDSIIREVVVNTATFANNYGSNKDESLTDVIISDNNEIVAIGTVQEGDNLDTYFLKLETGGGIVKTNELGGFYDNEGQKIIKRNGNFWLLSSGGQDGIFLQEVSQSGNRLNQFDYGNNKYDGINIIDMTNGPFAGRIIVPGADQSGTAFIQIHEGTSATYPAAENGKIWFVEKGFSGELVTTGESYRQACFSELSYQGPGNEAFMRYDQPGHESKGFVIKPVIAGGYLIVGELEYNPQAPVAERYDSDVLVIKIEDDGAVEWTKYFGGTGDDVGYDFIETQQGDEYIITGYTESSSNGGKDMLLLKVNWRGDEVFFRNFGGGGDETGFGLVENTAEGTFIVVGETTSFGNGKQAYVLKTDLEGKIQ